MRKIRSFALVILAVSALGLTACDKRSGGPGSGASGTQGMSPPASGTSP